jgi:plastocyanin
MKASFDISGYRPDTQVVLQAFKTYGLMLADNGSNWYFQGTSEDGWDSDMLDELKSIPAGAFEAVDASSLMVDPDSGQAGGDPPPPPPTGPAVTVKDFAFAPKAVPSTQGVAVSWSFTGPSNHTATDRSGMGLFGSGSRAPGAAWPFTFVAAGIYPYRCTVHPTKMQGSVKVPVELSDTGGPRAATFTVTWGAAALPSGYVADVQVKRPGATRYVMWKKGVTSRSASFTPDAGAGSYLFRARLRKPANGTHSTYSPVATYQAT